MNPGTRYRIYLEPDSDGRLQQARPFTNLFYDVEQSKSIDWEDSRWYKVVSTSAGRITRLLWDDVEGINSGARTDVLGARMVLLNDIWYAAAADVFLNDGILVPHFPLNYLKPLVILLLLLQLLFYALGWRGGWDLRPAAAGGAILGSLLLMADIFLFHWKPRRRFR